MRTVVASHIDYLSCATDTLECSLHHILGAPHEGDDSAVGGLTGIHIQKFHTLHGCDGIGDGLDFLRIAPFAEVGHTFDYTCFHDVV